MKKYWKTLAMLLAVSMLACGCSQKADGADTTAAAEETVAEESTAALETAGEAETEAPLPEVDMSKGLDENGCLEKELMVEGVVLPDYRSASFTRDQIFAAEEKVQEAIQDVLEQYGEEKEVKDRAIVDGDTVNIDFVGSIDGVEFEGGNSQGQGSDLVIGSHSFIDTFEEQLIGAKPGDEVLVKVTFPETYGKAELAGKAAEFKTTINYIVEVEIPELTDQWVEENLKEEYGLENVEALTKDIRDALDQEARMENLWAWFEENTTFANEPEQLVDILLDNYMDSIRRNVMMYGMKMEDYLAYLDMTTEDEMRESQRAEATTLAHRYIITQLISEQENITVDDAVLAEFFGGTDPASLIEEYGAGYVKMNVRMGKCIDTVAELITVTE